jgi:replicative DNA helicase
MADGGREIATRPASGVQAIEDRMCVLSDLDAERAVLGAVLIDEGHERSVWQRVSAIVGARHFHEPRHATMWEVFAAIIARGEALDLVTASAELRARGRFNTMGGAQFIATLTDDVLTTAHCEAHARLVVTAAARRELGTVALRLAKALTDGGADPMALRDQAVEAMRAVRIDGAKPADAHALVTEMWEGIEAGIAGVRPGPLPFGVPTLDRMSGGGMKRGGCYFVAARPGIGKTALACQIAGATSEAGERVLYVALEPKRVEIVQAITANRAGVGLVKITRAPKTLTQDDLVDLTSVSHAIASWPLHVVDETERDCPDTVAKIEAAMRALPSPPALVVIDHLLKLRAVGRHEKPHQGTAEVVAGLVSLGKRTGATMLVLCHIGRAMSGTSGLYRRPRVEDIAGGDGMVRDADGIIVLHREDKYPTAKENVENPLIAGHVDLLAPKLRGVEDNTFGRMRFRGEVQRFEAFEGRNEERDDAAQ